MNAPADHKSTTRDFAAADREFFRMIIPFIIGIILCMICLGSSTWALYSESFTVSGAVRSGMLTVTDLQVEDADGNLIDPAQMRKGSYLVTVETNATAETIGFCSVRIGTLVVNDTLSSQGGSFELILQGDLEGEMTATAFWGEPIHTLGENETALCIIDVDGTAYIGDEAEAFLNPKPSSPEDSDTDPE
jgi:hypothetical protein